MASLNFDESILLILFAQSGGDRGATRAELVSFDAGLQRDFGQMLLDIMGEEGMEADVHNRSVVLGCRPHMPGNTPEVQIRNACRYVLHAQQELGGPAIRAFRAQIAGPSQPKATTSPRTAAKSRRKPRKRAKGTRARE
jgi:hypothetical protein